MRGLKVWKNNFFFLNKSPVTLSHQLQRLNFSFLGSLTVRCKKELIKDFKKRTARVWGDCFGTFLTWNNRFTVRYKMKRCNVVLSTEDGMPSRDTNFAAAAMPTRNCHGETPTLLPCQLGIAMERHELCWMSCICNKFIRLVFKLSSSGILILFISYLLVHKSTKSGPIIIIKLILFFLAFVIQSVIYQ